MAAFSPWPKGAHVLDHMQVMGETRPQRHFRPVDFSDWLTVTPRIREHGTQTYSPLNSIQFSLNRIFCCVVIPVLIVLPAGIVIML